MVLAAKVQHLAIATVPVAAVWFATLYTGRGRWWPGIRRFAFIVPVTTAGDWFLLAVSYGSVLWLLWSTRICAC